MNLVVLDASVGVKWFRDEPGSEQAREILAAHGRGEVTIVVPSLFVYELMGVAARFLGEDDVRELWRRFLTWRIHVREIGDSLITDSLAVRHKLGCSLYDAVAPALADQLQAKLYSADERAHGGWPGVEVVA
jgi:predicted nucleic acid-binding protein